MFDVRYIARKSWLLALSVRSCQVQSPSKCEKKLLLRHLSLLESCSMSAGLLGSALARPLSQPTSWSTSPCLNTFYSSVLILWRSSRSEDSRMNDASILVSSADIKGFGPSSGLSDPTVLASPFSNSSRGVL